MFCFKHQYTFLWSPVVAPKQTFVTCLVYSVYLLYSLHKKKKQDCNARCILSDSLFKFQIFIGHPF